MPSYTHRCLDCGAEEVIVCAIADRDLPRKCPSCEGNFIRVFPEPSPNIMKLETIEDYVERHRGHLKNHIPPKRWDKSSNKRSYAPKEKREL